MDGTPPTLTVLFHNFLVWILLQETKSREGFNILNIGISNVGWLISLCPLIFQFVLLCCTLLCILGGDISGWSHPVRELVAADFWVILAGCWKPGRKRSRFLCSSPLFSGALCYRVITLGTAISFHCVFIPQGGHSSLLLVDPGVSVSFIISPNCLACLPLLHMV